MTNYDHCGCCGKIVCPDDGCPGCARWRKMEAKRSLDEAIARQTATAKPGQEINHGVLPDGSIWARFCSNPGCDTLGCPGDCRMPADAVFTDPVTGARSYPVMDDSDEELTSVKLVPVDESEDEFVTDVKGIVEWNDTTNG